MFVGIKKYCYKGYTCQIWWSSEVRVMLLWLTETLIDGWSDCISPGPFHIRRGFCKITLLWIFQVASCTGKCIGCHRCIAKNQWDNHVIKRLGFIGYLQLSLKNSQVDCELVLNVDHLFINIPPYRYLPAWQKKNPQVCHVFYCFFFYIYNLLAL